jgi:hypothetical protein
MCIGNKLNKKLKKIMNAVVMFWKLFNIDEQHIDILIQRLIVAYNCDKFELFPIVNSATISPFKI